MTDHVEQLRSELSDRYTIESELGRGGMATVYLAHDIRHDRSVALKVLHRELATALGPERFQREVRLAARFQHPHILTVHDSGETAGLLWFTMPFVEGETLRQRLRRERQLPVADALRITREAADALDYAHRHGVIHRDIKPENILLSDHHALVADFGIARAVAAAGDDRLTATGVTVGTAEYMSPEQAAGDRDLDGRADVYSLAIVLYEMLAGETPFAAASPQATISRRFVETPRPVTAIRESVPPAVAAAVARALSRTPADRFASASEFADALAPSGEVAAFASPASAAAPRITPPSRRVLFAVAAVIILALGGGFFWSRGRGGPPPDQGVRRLAVLPFENVGAPDDQYFTDGVTDAVRGKLTAVPGLLVTASASSDAYRGTTKSPRQIAQELGVGWLLVGKVRWARQPDGTSRVQVSPELIEVTTSAATWQQAFDATLTDVFQVQADIATRVAGALHVALGDSARLTLAARPTNNIAAYDAFLRGEAASNRGAAGDLASVRRAAEFYERATSLDPAFTLAWARLAQMESFIYALFAPTPAGAETARHAMEKVSELAPKTAIAYSVSASYYQLVPKDLARAADDAAAGLLLAPDDAELLTVLAPIEIGLGRWQSALAHLQHAAELDPRSAATARQLGGVLRSLRRLPEAQEVLDHGLALAPNELIVRQERLMVDLARGDLPAAQAIVRQAPSSVDPVALVVFVSTYNDLYWVLTEDQQLVLLRLGPEAFDGDRANWSFVLAQLHSMRGDVPQARAYADTALGIFTKGLREVPDDPQVHALRGITLALLGRYGEAIQEGERSVALLPMSKDAIYGQYMQHQLARIYIMAGKYDLAMDQLEALLAEPSDLTAAWLRIDPNFAPLRGNSRFERLAAAGRP